MDDLISRQALMKEFSDFVRASNSSDFAQTPTWNDAVSLVGSMPAAQQWIPCSERLPERGKDVLVTRDYDGREDYIKSCRYVEVASCYGEDGDITWYSFSDEYKMRPRNHHVDAWMPLPKPYKEKRQWMNLNPVPSVGQHLSGRSNLDPDSEASSSALCAGQRRA